FRYSPAVRYMKELIDEGWVGTPYIYNAYEQNSQWIDPQTPLRQVPSDAQAERIRVSSLEGYGAPVIDLGHWFMDADLTSGGDVHEPWPSLYYSNLTANFVDEILTGDEKNEGNFSDAAWVQEVINAVEQSHFDRGWVELPLPR